MKNGLRIGKALISLVSGYSLLKLTLKLTDSGIVLVDNGVEKRVTNVSGGVIGRGFGGSTSWFVGGCSVFGLGGGLWFAVGHLHRGRDSGWGGDGNGGGCDGAPPLTTGRGGGAGGRVWMGRSWGSCEL